MEEVVRRRYVEFQWHEESATPGDSNPALPSVRHLDSSDELFKRGDE